jgi:hypothetical protein
MGLSVISASIKREVVILGPAPEIYNSLKTMDSRLRTSGMANKKQSLWTDSVYIYNSKFRLIDS